MEQIVVVGSLNMDFAVEVKEMPEKGETILGKKVSLIPGGKGANQAYAVSRLGKKVQMIGAVGTDIFGDKLVGNLEKAGVGTEGICRVENRESGQAFVFVNEAGENSITVIQGANQDLTEARVDENEERIDRCDAVVMQLEVPVPTVVHTAQVARKKGKLVYLDPAPARPDLPDELFASVDIMKPNETELKILTGMEVSTGEEIILAAKSLLKKGVGAVIVTLGEKGCVLVTEKLVKEFPARKVKAVDTTAAGDSFTAGFLAAYEPDGEKREENLEEALLFAGKVSAIAVTRKGAQSSIPTLAEVMEEQKGGD
ncbi:ribokinase [uncultured Clostridium sp.]|uniref:ribokinase n=1 Tax=uncultured Clostridium sp. TaxID=59620 RepID=UPI0025E01EC2|nr:ribokinase [uncultured Clostridium sp.]